MRHNVAAHSCGGPLQCVFAGLIQAKNMVCPQKCVSFSLAGGFLVVLLPFCYWSISKHQQFAALKPKALPKP